MSGIKSIRALTAIFFASCMMHFASSQCFSEFDDTSKPSSSDLSGITDFGLTLFKELFPYHESKNFFFSPYSIWSALALSYFGSKGDTELQLQKALGVTDKIDTLKQWRELEFIYKMRQMNKSDYTFTVANRAYFDKTVRLNSCVENILKSELRLVDFNKVNKVVSEINDWVSNTTKGRIPDLVTAKDLAQANMVLTNAAYFKGNWLSQFKKSDTSKAVFYISDQKLSFVDMMVQKGSFKHGTSEELGAHILELPYTGESISMLLLLPPFITGEKGFAAMVNRLNSTTLTNALNDMWRTEVEVSVPKFKLEESVGDEMMGALSKMGISDLFNPAKSNLTDFSPDGGLSVGKTIHKAFVEVSEEGTEAAAATALISFRSARPVGPSKFVCNHPFLFIIYDNVTNNVLFLGAYKFPKKA